MILSWYSAMVCDEATMTVGDTPAVARATMAALFANSSIALNSVAGENVDFALATAGVSPTPIG
jgi:hypothetical protein